MLCAPSGPADSAYFVKRILANRAQASTSTVYVSTVSMSITSSQIDKSVIIRRSIFFLILLILSNPPVMIFGVAMVYVAHGPIEMVIRASQRARRIATGREPVPRREDSV